MGRTFQLTAKHLCCYSTWMELVVNLVAFSLLSQITVLSSEFHEERPSAPADLTRCLWDDTKQKGEGSTLSGSNKKPWIWKCSPLTVFVTFTFVLKWLHQPKPERYNWKYTEWDQDGWLQMTCYGEKFDWAFSGHEHYYLKIGSVSWNVSFWSVGKHGWYSKLADWKPAMLEILLWIICYT